MVCLLEYLIKELSVFRKQATITLIKVKSCKAYVLTF